jgi:hypothetical protein
MPIPSNRPVNHANQVNSQPLKGHEFMNLKISLKMQGGLIGFLPAIAEKRRGW